MIAPLLLLIASLSGIALAFAPGWSDLMLIALPCAIASLFLLWRARPQKQRNWVIVDGSNVMNWNGGVPKIETARAVLSHLIEKGFTPAIVFDANVGYKIGDSYKHDHALGRMLGLPQDRVMVVNKGTPADPTILAAARDLNARIVSNDRFRDWADQHPEVNEPGRVIRGGIVGGAMWMDLS
ncbi:MAG: hypothetical protein H7317_05055 [Pseudorhodobacter sp.]|nr:hypothetical protein [Pseudorhodobacter sp.]